MRPFQLQLRSLIALVVFVALVIALVVQERNLRSARLEREIAENNLEVAKADADLRVLDAEWRAQKTIDQRVAEERQRLEDSYREIKMATQLMLRVLKEKGPEEFSTRGLESLEAEIQRQLDKDQVGQPRPESPRP